ncbi:translation elongation factor Ts [Conexibacter woesei]|uniref:Elongation factor Ts n=1 Tax=Conexibacter woesei (strain DSM 14684 / CCUG 47730 / CIP 108061 / JCM 11494 / NBRC 100937 / ID131577) TaxID=469383 RepID=D3F074_CONWI|nr:translation elongation factor Ts [Conexibacter woesei]ADB51934.1 translation elongation factor Ts [Conexibacter woesei DSM 14684]
MSTAISAQDVKALRERTGAGMMDCKKALVEAGGDIEKAVEALRVKGIAKAEKRGDRGTSEGTVQSYIHANGKIGALVEVDCETDFVARNEDYIGFAKDLALHVAAAGPISVDDDGVPAEEIERERRIAEEQFADKPEQIRPRIVQGKVDSWLKEVVLLRQVHVNGDKYEGRTIEEIRAALASRTGENIVIRRFTRFAVGD